MGAIIKVILPLFLSKSKVTCLLQLTAQLMEGQIKHQFGRLPPEIYLLIAETLTVPDPTRDCPYAIFNLARCSQSMYNMINDWAACLVQMELTFIQEAKRGQLTWVKQHTTGLSVLCSKLAGSCTFCNLRTWDSATNTISGNLNLCEACHCLFFPIISHQRLRLYYKLSRSAAASKVLQHICHVQLRNPDGRTGPIYLWTEIEHLVQTGDLILKTPMDYNFERFHSEEYGLLFPTSHGFSTRASYWPQRFPLYRLLKSECNSPIGDDTTLMTLSDLRPIMVEVRLLDQFRFLFDSRWKPRQTPHVEKEEIARYFNIARHWIKHSIWEKRPWWIRNLRLLPRCLITNPHATTEQKKQSVRDIEQYVRYCTGIRNVMRAFPDILSDIVVWQACEAEMIASHDAAVRIAEQERARDRTEVGGFIEKFSIAITRRPYDVVLHSLGDKEDPSNMIDVVMADGSCITMDGNAELQ